MGRPPAPTSGATDARVGLCARCLHARLVRSAKGSEFWLCRRSETEPERYRKYPPLPVRVCAGFTPTVT
jgi:hypothetical protein